MIEGHNINSAEKNYEMDSYEVRVHPFAHDPVGYLQEFYARTLESGHDEQSGVFKVIDEFTSVIMALADNDVTTESDYIVGYIHADNAYDQKKAFIKLLRAVGIKREHLQVWADIEVSDSSSAERLEEKSYGLAINEVYGEGE